jgi:hypothetical protein
MSYLKAMMLKKTLFLENSKRYGKIFGGLIRVNMEKVNEELFPNVSNIMAQLKDFQRKTVRYAFKQMFEIKNPTRRFLIADEVGLGKTLVARGLIAKAIDHFKNDIKNGIRRYDIIYICSNTEIAKQNINRLNVIGGVEKKEITFTSRITLLPVELQELKKNRINFVSFTPGTSFNLRSREGTYKERALIYHILKEKWNLDYRPKYVKFFQCHAKFEYWEKYLKNFRKKYEIDEFLTGEFLGNLESKINKENKNNEENIFNRFLKIADKFNYLYKGKKVSSDISRERNKIVGELRLLLAKTCISSLDPNFIILDEFQRFKNLLDGEDEMCRIAREMFDFKDAKLLLLSATPYKMYTMYQDDEIHYDDFIRTAKFLLSNKDDWENSRKDISSLEKLLERYKFLLYQLNKNNLDEISKCKKKIEKILLRVMCRTEKNSGILKQDSMIRESEEDIEIDKNEIIDFIQIDKIAQLVKHRNCIEYWKSSPYLLNFMDDYKLKKDCLKEIDNGTSKIIEALLNSKKSLLSWRTIRKYRRISPKNHKMKSLLNNTMNNEEWKLLWIPPSLPYYKSNTFFDGLKNYTKNLIFSSWKLVPRSITSLCSYEAERYAKIFNEEEYNYEGEKRRQIKELVFAMREEKPASMNLMTLFYPCITLAKKINPLKIAQKYIKDYGNIPDIEEIEKDIKEKIQQILEQTALSKKLDTKGSIDQRWYWASLVFLDRVFYKDKIEEWFSLGKDHQFNFENLGRKSGEKKENLSKNNEETEEIDISHFAEHIKSLKELFRLEPQQIVKELGYPPDDLLSVLAKIALASPAVVSLRALYDYSNGFSSLLLYNASSISYGFRSLYVLPETISVIKKLFPDGPYWKKILDYNGIGNIQSLLDEYMYILYESLGLMNLYNRDKVVCELGAHIEKVVSIRTSNLFFDEIKIKNDKIEKVQKRGMRCRFAMRFGKEVNQLSQEVSTVTDVRNAFNSPFRPFILASTSIGQEGLDFHQYCHSIYHWNLPPNPVDLEQREGRIFRYKGHVIRKNIAEYYGLEMLSKAFSGKLWDNLFKIAWRKREKGTNDLVPFWIFNHGAAKIQRHIPAMPMSKEQEQKQALSKSSAVYRMVFGQPRQEDLVNFINSQIGIKNDGLTIDELINYRIDLTPQ